VRLVFNQVADDEPVQRVFETLLAYCHASKTVEPRLTACLHSNEIYSLVRGTDQSLKGLAADTTDYKQLIAQAGSANDKVALAQALAIQRLARGVLPELDACFAALDLQSLLFEGLVSGESQQLVL
jgi:hypothetical protein